jgi:septin family protein
MKYLAIIFILIIIIGLLANRELARDKKRIKRKMREYSFRTYSPEDEVEEHPEKETKEEKKL